MRLKKLTILLLGTIFILPLAFNGFGQTNLFIAKDGDDTNSGSLAEPLASLVGARDKIRSIRQSSGLPEGGIVVNIRKGSYPIMGTCSLDAQDTGEPGKPIIYTGYQDEEVIFDGSYLFDASQFTKVKGADFLERLHPKGKNNVLKQTISNAGIINLLKTSGVQLTFNGGLMIAARFPNIGFAHIDPATIDETLEVVDEQGSVFAPKGGEFKLYESIQAERWLAELNRTIKASVTGYISAVWLKESLRILSIKSTGEIVLIDGSRYGLNATGNHEPKRLFVQNMLCELDQPGEWYFDENDNDLYIWPSHPLDKKTRIGVLDGGELFSINNASHIKIRKMVIQNIGKGTNGDGAIDITGQSSYVQIAGVRFKNIAAPITAVNIIGGANGVTNSGVLSCDFYDIPIAIRLYGGDIQNNTIVHGNNYVRNCLFTQINSIDYLGKAVGIIGAGQIFENNLIHNMNAQTLTHAGVDHTIRKNEIFNVGIEEGDGGAFYTGGDLSSYGNVIKHNFAHHIMNIPGLLGRSTFFSDDLDGGETVTENIIYKGGYQAIKANAGGGHIFSKNFVLESFHPFYSRDNGAAQYNSAIAKLTANPSDPSKENYIGNMLRKIGVDGWEVGISETNWRSKVDPFWTSRYPTLGTVLDQYSTNNEINSYEVKVEDNFIYSNDASNNIGATTIETGTSTIALDVFENPEVLDFSFKGTPPASFPDIPFDSIGLYVDEYRKSIPDKSAYRKRVKERFDGVTSFAFESYDHETINDRIYYNTGKVVKELTPPSSEGGPIVEFVKPVIGLTLAEGKNIEVEITAIDKDSIKEAKLYFDDAIIRTINKAPYEWGLVSQSDAQLSNLSAGVHTLKIEALDRKDSLTIREIEFTVETPYNVAINKPATQSSEFLGAGGIPRGPANLAVDGNTDGLFVNGSVTLTSSDDNAWWQVDLDSIFDIDTIKVWNRADASVVNRLSNFRVFVSETPFISTSISEVLTQSGVTSFLTAGTAGRPTSINIKKSGRYVRIQLLGENFLHIAEVEVLGTKRSNITLPVADAGSDLMASGGEDVMLDGSNSYQDLDVPITYSWQSLDGILLDDATLAKPKFNAPISDNALNLTFVLTVSDGLNDSTDTVKVTIDKIDLSNASNVALNKAASQSSELLGAGGIPRAPANLAVDGNTNGDFYDGSVSNTDNDVNAWWQVDLGALFYIDSIKVWNRSDAVTDRLSNFYVLVSPVPFASTNLNSVLLEGSVTSFLISGPAGHPTSINTKKKGRYVRVQLAGTNYLNLSELQVLGIKATPGNTTWNGILWDNGLPTATDTAIIAANLDITNAISMARLEVQSGNKLTIKSSGSLDVKGGIVKEGDIFVESGASLLTYSMGTVSGSGNITIERVTRYADGRYSFVGTPVEQTSSITGANLGSHVYKYDETVSFGIDGLNRWIPASTDQLIPGTGYTQSFKDTLKFIGIPNTGIVIHNGSYTAGAEAGFNLVANPYTAAISVTGFLNENDNVSSLYIWDDNGSNINRGDNNDYITINELGFVNSTSNAGNQARYNNYLGTSQGFIVSLIDASQTDITFNESMRVAANNSDNAFFRKNDIPLIRLSLSGNDISNETLIGFTESASLTSLVHRYDAKKYAIDNALEIHSVKEETDLAIQGVPLTNQEIVLGFTVKKSGLYDVNLSEAKNIEGFTILLNDKHNNKSYDILDTNSLSFKLEEGSNNKRFSLTLSSDGSTKSLVSPFTAYLEDNRLGIVFNNSELNEKIGDIYVYGMLGKTVANYKNVTLKNFKAEERISFNPNTLYLIRVSTNSNELSGKFIFNSGD